MRKEQEQVPLRFANAFVFKLNSRMFIQSKSARELFVQELKAGAPPDEDEVLERFEVGFTRFICFLSSFSFFLISCAFPRLSCMQNSLQAE